MEDKKTDNQLNDDTKYYTLNEVGDKLGVTRQAAHSLYKSGAFPNTLKKGRRLRFDKNDVDLVIRERVMQLVADIRTLGYNVEVSRID
jgi:predicted DNA-binding transcriptional regulator AlpA